MYKKQAKWYDPGGGGGVLPCIRHRCMCRPKGRASRPNMPGCFVSFAPIIQKHLPNRLIWLVNHRAIIAFAHLMPTSFIILPVATSFLVGTSQVWNLAFLAVICSSWCEGMGSGTGWMWRWILSIWHDLKKSLCSLAIHTYPSTGIQLKESIITNA